MEEAACQVEHIVKKGIEEKICGLLGHPQTCPHGKPIPPGDCCRKARETKERFVVPLTNLKLGEKGGIAYIKAGDARRGAMRGLVVNKLEARRDLTDIRARKSGLMSEINHSSLTRSEQQELQGLLSTISDG